MRMIFSLLPMCWLLLGSVKTDLIAIVGESGVQGQFYESYTGEASIAAGNFGLDINAKLPGTVFCGGKLYMAYKSYIYEWDQQSNITKSHNILSSWSGSVQPMLCMENNVIISDDQYCQMNVATPYCVNLDFLSSSTHYVKQDDSHFWAFKPDSSASLYDLSTGYRMQDLRPMHEPRTNYGLVKLDSNRILVCGGISTNTSQPTAHCEMIDTSTKTPYWQDVKPMQKARYNFGLLKLSDGRVYAIGNSHIDATVETSWDPARYDWMYTNELYSPVIHGFTAQVVRTGWHTSTYRPRTSTYTPTWTWPAPTSSSWSPRTTTTPWWWGSSTTPWWGSTTTSWWPRSTTTPWWWGSTTTGRWGSTTAPWWRSTTTQWRSRPTSSYPWRSTAHALPNAR